MNPPTPLWWWFATIGLIAVLLMVDLASNGGRRVTLGRALIASIGWIAVSIMFGIVLGLAQGGVVAEEYFTAYLFEKALSVDNVFVFVALFASFGVPAVYQHRVLYFGVIGALILRAACIAGGATLLETFSWILYVFGAVVLVAGLRMLMMGEVVNSDRNLLVRAVRCLLPVTSDYHGSQFFVREGRRLVGTPLLVALIAVESTDIVFAADSIPAVFGVTQDVFVVFTSNAFAVLGLRALYFVLADFMDRFRFLKWGLALLLIFIGTKLILTDLVDIPLVVSLAVIVGTLGVSIGASVLLHRNSSGYPP